MPELILNFTYLFICLFIYFVEARTELSDLERRVRGLCEQLRKKKNEAEKLQQEQQRKKKEQLRIKEQSLLKQIRVRNNVSYSHCKPQT
jgi:predicted Holliday junction resolvase-like endonuclease